jgi:DNA polymerase III alpha subunit
MSKINKSEAIHALESIVELQKKRENFIVFIPSKKDLTEDELMAKEFELLGYYLTKHPLDNYKSKLASVDKIGELSEYPTGKQIAVCGIIVECKVIQTKALKTMAFLQLEDLTGRMEIVVFPRTYDNYKSYIKPNALIEITGKVEIEESETEVDPESLEVELPKRTAKILATNIKQLEEMARIKELRLKLNCKEDLKEIAKTLKYQVGNIPIFIEYDNFLLETSFRISQNVDVLNKLRELCLIKEIKE